MEKTNFENLRVYQLSAQLADELWPHVLKWSSLARDTVGKQLIRAADSIGANLAEGTGRGSVMDNRRFARIARGSLYETKHWLQRAERRQLLAVETVTSLNATVEELTRPLNGYLRYLNQPKP